MSLLVEQGMLMVIHSASGGPIRDSSKFPLTLHHQVESATLSALGNDIPRNFREKLYAALLGGKPVNTVVGDAKQPKQKSTALPFLHLAMQQMSVHGAIFLLGHYWDTHALAPALAVHNRG